MDWQTIAAGLVVMWAVAYLARSAWVAQRVDAAQLEDRIAHGRLDQHREVSAGRHLDRHLADGQAEHVDRLAFERQPLELAVGPAHQLHDQLQFHFAAHGRFTEDRLDVEQTEAAHFEQVLQQRRAASFDEIRAEANEVDCIIGDETVAAADQLQAEFALAEA